MPEQPLAHLVVSYLNPDNTIQTIDKEGKRAGYRFPPAGDPVDHVMFWIDMETIIIPFNRLICGRVITPRNNDESPH